MIVTKSSVVEIIVPHSTTPILSLHALLVRCDHARWVSKITFSDFVTEHVEDLKRNVGRTLRVRVVWGVDLRYVVGIDWCRWSRYTFLITVDVCWEKS